MLPPKISKTIKAFISSICLFSLILMSLGTAVRAEDTGTVAATVTVQNISVTVTDSTVTYGTLANNSTKGTHSGDLNDTQTANNNGNIAETFNIKGQDSADWTLAGTAGSDSYVHQFCTATCTAPPTNYTVLTTSYQELAAGVAKDADQTFDLYINTPDPSTVYTEQSVDVIVQATS